MQLPFFFATHLIGHLEPLQQGHKFLLKVRLLQQKNRKKPHMQLREKD